MTQRGQSIVLIGFMGVGKSSTGAALAQKTGLPCFDTDVMVSDRLCMSVPEVFNALGEEAFRNTETEILVELSDAENCIIVTGGGIVLRPNNVEILRRLGRVVCLEADEETLLRRISGSAIRPLLQTEDPRATLLELSRVRDSLYQKAADICLDTSCLTPDEAADAVLESVAQL